MSSPVRKCPICRKPALPETMPFCSKICKYRDMLKWLGDGYVIEGQDGDSYREDDLEDDGF